MVRVTRRVIGVLACVLAGCAQADPLESFADGGPSGAPVDPTNPRKPPVPPVPSDELPADDEKGCGDITELGVCRGPILVKCIDDALSQVLCNGPAEVCALIDGVTGHGCVPREDAPPDGPLPPSDSPPNDGPASEPPPNDGPPNDVPPNDVPPNDVPPNDVPPQDPLPPAGADCGALDYLGVCEGPVAVYCDMGVVARVDCAAVGQGCEWIDAVTGFFCAEGGAPDAPLPDAPPPVNPPPADVLPPAGGPCGALDYLGLCDGDVAVWCEGEVVHLRDCREMSGLGCGWVDEVTGNYCGGQGDGPPPDVAPPPDASPPETPPPNGGQSCYSEPFNDGASLVAAQNLLARDWEGAAVEAMRLRWPAGYALLQQGAMEDLRSFGDGSSMSSLSESMMTVIHEGTHGWDYGHANWGQTFAYFMRGDLTVTIPHVEAFPRSEIRGDLPDDSTDLYAGTYLDGGEQGDRGFPEMMDEGNCYINGMIAIAVLGDQYQGGGFSGRDGALAFLLYTQLYLRRARLHHPDDYAALRAEPEIRRLVELQWLRTHFWLPIADRYENIGIDDDQIRRHLYTAQNLEEMRLFLGFSLGNSACR